MVFPILSIFQDLDFDKLLGVGDKYMTSCTDGNYRMTVIVHIGYWHMGYWRPMCPIANVSHIN